jgi:hypothetical protein
VAAAGAVATGIPIGGSRSSWRRCP